MDIILKMDWNAESAIISAKNVKIKQLNAIYAKKDSILAIKSVLNVICKVFLLIKLIKFAKNVTQIVRIVMVKVIILVQNVPTV